MFNTKIRRAVVAAVQVQGASASGWVKIILVQKR
jgi:hypothetical protein